MQTLLGQLGDGQLLGDVDVGQLKQAALAVALFEVVHNDIQQRRRQQRAHNGQIGGDGVHDADDLALGRVGGNVQHIEVGVGVERQRFRFIEALGAHGTLGLVVRLLLGSQTAGGDLRCLQEGRLDMLVAVFADDFLRQIRLADLNVLTPAGRGDLHGVAVGFQGDGKLQTGENIQNRIGRHGDAQNSVDAADFCGELLALARGTGRAVKVGGGDLAAAQLLDQVQGACHTQLGGILGDALLVMAGSVGVLTQTAGGLADIVAGKLGAFKQQLGGAVLDLAVQTAHNTGQCHGLGAVADDKVIGGQGELFFVKGGDLLAVLGAAHDDLAAFQRVHIKGVHRLTDFQHNVVGDVHNVGDAAQPAQCQPAAHPARGLAGGDVVNIMTDVARAKVGRFHGDGQARLGGFADGVVRCGHLQRLAQHGGNLTRNAQNALAVGAVGGDGNIKNIIIQPHNILNGGAGYGVLGQIQQTVYLGTGVQVVIQTQLGAAAQHTVGLDAHKGLCLDFNAAGQRRAVQRRGGVHTGVNIGSAGGNLDIVTVIAAIHLADVQVGALLRDTLGDNADNDLADLAAEVDEFLDLKAAVKQLALQLLGGDVDIYILL